MNENILYTFRRCPYAMRARWALICANQSVIWREVSLKEKPVELLRVSPKATVPVLITSEGEVIEESIQIMRWALEINDRTNILCKDDYNSQKKIEKFIQMNDGLFKYHLDRYKYPNRFLLCDRENHKKLAREILLEWNSIILDNANSYWLVNGKESLADWAIWPFVRQYRIVDPISFDHENALSGLRVWLSSYLNNSKFKTLMVKSKPWIYGEKKKYFPPILTC